ncbi:MAG: hypothetical protein H6509_03805 [Bryobacterales bacterium]|nr:hypothetical protein [Acidobacteriota bacterium]MCB9383716.1 hypothetical protein [Bryobacterales bacterium]
MRTPQRKSGWSAGLLGACLAAAGVLVYAKAGRPRMLRWGATEREAREELPGDELLPEFDVEATRAVTVLAPCEFVWPWLMQIGQDRGGFYSYTALENLVGCEMPTVNQIIAEWPARSEGEIVWMAPAYRYAGEAYMVAARVETDRAFVLHRPGSLWSFVLEPVGDDACRLIVRTRTGEGALGGGHVLQRLFWEPAHFVMERRMMLRVRQLAERRYWAARRSNG